MPDTKAINVFGYPYWQFDSLSGINPVVPNDPINDPISPIDLALIPKIIPVTAPGMDGTPFFEITVRNAPLGSSLLTWGLKRSFSDPLPYRFEVYWAETPTGAFTKVATPVLINTYWALDEEQRMFALDIESCYAIRLVTSVGEYWSYATSANSSWRKKDWLIAREICRKELLMFRKFTGWSGFLLKRRIWGAPCPRCKDFDTQDPSDGHCLVCFGTGKEGGYWPLLPTFTYNMGDGPGQFKQMDENKSLTEDVVFQKMRMPGYPHLATNDVFIHYGSGRRFFVRPVKIAAEIKGSPIIHECELRLAPYTDVIYQFPPAPPAPPVPPTPPAPESEPTYEQPPAPPTVRITWASGEWRMWRVVGDTEQPLYHTTGGYPLPNALDSFTWLKEDETPADIVLTEDMTGYQITGNPEASGLYLPNGLYAGLPVFCRELE